MSSSWKYISALLVVIIVVIANIIMAFVLASVAYIELISVAGCSKGFSLVVAILVATAVHMYILLQPRIRNYIRQGASNI